MGKRSRTKRERRMEGGHGVDAWVSASSASDKSNRTGVTHVAQTSLRSSKDILVFFKLNVPLILLIVLLAIIGYANGLIGQFLSADDIPGIVQNPKLHDFIGIAKSLNLISTYASSVVNIFGASAFVFHLVSLLMHVLNATLVMLLAYLLFGKRAALYASLIFCLLPSGSEAVFWISGMGYLFQAVFSLFCLNLFFLFRTTGNRRFFLLSVVVYLSGLIFLQTPWLFTVPMIILVLDLFCFDGKPFTGFADVQTSSKKWHNRRRVSLFRLVISRWWAYASYLVSTGIYWIIFMSGRFSARITALVTDYYVNPDTSTALIFRLPYTLYKTVELYLVPLRLSFFHEEMLTRPVYYAMAGVSILMLGLTVYLALKRSRYAGLLLAILFSIAPTFSPVQVAWFIAERYLYFGGAFFAMTVTLTLIKVDQKVRLRNFASYLLVLILTLYSVRLITRANDFKSSKALWTATQKTAPTSYRVYNNLGDVYSNEQAWDKAIENFNRAITLEPAYADAIHNLGYAYALKGDMENAKKYLLESYEKNPRLWQALEKLGQIELMQGNKDKAQEYFDKVKRLNPQIQDLPNTGGR